MSEAYIQELSTKDLSTLCIGCLKTAHATVFLGDQTENAKRLTAKYIFLLHFENLNLFDKGPLNLCKICERKLNKSIEFVEQCLNSHSLILKVLADYSSTIAQRHYGKLGADLNEILKKINVPEETKNLTKENSCLKPYSIEEVEAAIKAVHKKLEPCLRCIFCHFKANSTRSLSAHVSVIHREHKVSWCSACNQTFSNLTAHRKNSHLKDLNCPFCHQLHTSKSHLVEHITRHSSEYLDRKTKSLTKDDEKDIKRSSQYENDNDTTVGVEDFDGNDYLGQKVHQKRKTELCQHCGKRFTSSKLSVHLRVHTGETPYKCSYCEKQFKTRNILISHHRTHTGERPFACSECGKGFTQSSSLNTHLKIHKGRPIHCTMCKKQFCRPVELRNHMRTHTGEKPFSCDQCSQSFKQKSHLTEHKKRHSDERPFRCGCCEKSFKDSSTFKSHSQIHSGEKPFKCLQCSYACRQPYSLKQHMKQHETDRSQSCSSHQCEMCLRGFVSQGDLNSHVNRLHKNVQIKSL